MFCVLLHSARSDHYYDHSYQHGIITHEKDDYITLRLRTVTVANVTQNTIGQQVI